MISRYCRVRAYLEGDGTVTPTLEQLELSYSGNITSAYQSFSYDDAGNLTEKESVNDSGAVTDIVPFTGRPEPTIASTNSWTTR